MELHLPLVCAIPNAPWLEYIPQLDDITSAAIDIRDGLAYPADTPGLGIAWDWEAIAKMQSFSETLTEAV